MASEDEELEQRLWPSAQPEGGLRLEPTVSGRCATFAGPLLVGAIRLCDEDCRDPNGDRLGKTPSNVRESEIREYRPGRVGEARQ